MGRDLTLRRANLGLLTQNIVVNNPESVIFFAYFQYLQGSKVLGSGLGVRRNRKMKIKSGTGRKGIDDVWIEIF
jgi:hypothetical protein